MKNSETISFRPALLPTLVTLVLAPLLAGLGFWQLERAEQKRELQQQFDRGAAALVELSDTLPRYQRVSVRGRFDEVRQFLLDNMLYEGVPGFHVLSVLEIPGETRRLLVNRGWIPAPAERGELPDPVLPVGEQRVTGRLDRLPRPGLKLAGEAVTGEGGWPRLAVFPDIGELAEALPYPLYPMVLLMDEGGENGFRRDWSPVNFGPERHIAYAVQWFALCVTLLVIFVVVNLERGDSP